MMRLLHFVCLKISDNPSTDPTTQLDLLKMVSIDSATDTYTIWNLWRIAYKVLHTVRHEGGDKVPSGPTLKLHCRSSIWTNAQPLDVTWHCKFTGIRISLIIITKIVAASLRCQGCGCRGHGSMRQSLGKHQFPRAKVVCDGKLVVLIVTMIFRHHSVSRCPWGKICRPFVGSISNFRAFIKAEWVWFLVVNRIYINKSIA